MSSSNSAAATFESKGGTMLGLCGNGCETQMPPRAASVPQQRKKHILDCAGAHRYRLWYDDVTKKWQGTKFLIKVNQSSQVIDAFGSQVEAELRLKQLEEEDHMDEDESEEEEETVVEHFDQESTNFGILCATADCVIMSADKTPFAAHLTTLLQWGGQLGTDAYLQRTNGKTTLATAHSTGALKVLVQHIYHYAPGTTPSPDNVVTALEAAVHYNSPIRNRLAEQLLSTVKTPQQVAQYYLRVSQCFPQDFHLCQHWFDILDGEPQFVFAQPSASWRELWLKQKVLKLRDRVHELEGQ